MLDLGSAASALLRDYPDLADAVIPSWPAIGRRFPPDARDRWLRACAAMADASLGQTCVLAYLRGGLACAEIVGPDPVIGLGDTAITVGRIAGVRAAQALLAAAPKAVRRLGTPSHFREWLAAVERLAPMAPESMAPMLDRTEGLLAELDPAAFEAWALAGVRAAADDPGRRLAFFLLSTRESLRALHREADDLAFSAVERRLKAYLAALWRLRAPVRHPKADAAGGVPRRASFSDGLVWMPETFRGVAGQRAEDLFRASLVHIGAHLRHSGPRFPVGSLKPLQVALVSLIEDARVEQLAMRGYPGLRRLWLPFHVAEPGGAGTAPVLMARLARALIDPQYRDDNAWVAKGRALFFEREDSWADPAISRTIGGLLGNDLGQMRVQFNAKTYVVEPAYRDDNLGLWDFGDSAAANRAEAETVYEAYRVEPAEQDGDPSGVPPEPQKADPAERPDRGTPAPDDPEIAAPPVRYPEWDYLIGRERPDWSRVVERFAYEGSARSIDRIIDQHKAVVERLTALVRSAKVSRPAWLRRQPEGDRLDLDACIEAALSRRRGETPDTRVYATLARRHRDLSVLLLLDISASTNDLVRGTDKSILTLERHATALFANTLAELGDPFAIHAFCSNGREEVRYYRIKDFRRPYDAVAKARLAGLAAELSTRLGTALKHAGRILARQSTHRRLLLVITDGEPSDIDIADRRYLLEDARKAVLALSHLGIDVFGIGLDPNGKEYLSRMFGQRNFLVMDRVERLPEKLPALYLRLSH